METLVTVLAGTLVLTGVVLARLPVGQCAECPHCAAARLAMEREVENQAGRLYGIQQCPACGRYHTREEPHRR